MKTWVQPLAWATDHAPAGAAGPPTERAGTVRLTEACDVGLGLGESDVEVCMTSSMEPNAPPVNQRTACAPYRMRAAAVQGDPRMPTVEGVVADGGPGPAKIG